MIFLLKVNRTPAPPLLSRPVEPTWKEVLKWIITVFAVAWTFVDLMQAFGPEPTSLQSAVNLFCPILMMIPMSIAIIRKVRFRYMLAIGGIAYGMGEGMSASLQEFAPELFNLGLITIMIVDTVLRSIAAGFIFKRWYA